MLNEHLNHPSCGTVGCINVNHTSYHHKTSVKKCQHFRHTMNEIQYNVSILISKELNSAHIPLECIKISSVDVQYFDINVKKVRIEHFF